MRTLLAFVTAAALLAPFAATSQVLDMPGAGSTPSTADAYPGEEVELDARQLGPAVATPRKGDSMKAVLKRFGEPTTRHRTVGGSSRRQPPITRWDYPQFNVTFEYSHVVRAVVPGQPPPLEREDGLRRVGTTVTTVTPVP